MRGWGVAAVAAVLGIAAGCARKPEKALFTGEPYLVVWAGDADRQNADFLAVLDADPTSPSYGKVMKTYPVRSRGNEPHAVNPTVRADRRVFASGVLTNRTFVFDLRQPLAARLTHVDEPGPEGRKFGAPQQYAMLPNGHAVVTCADPVNYRGTPREILGAPGGLVELDADGTFVREVPAADAAARHLIVAPSGATVVSRLDRLVTTNAGHGYAGTTQGERMPGISVQIWKLSSLELVQTVVLEAGPRGEENLGPVTARALQRHPTVFVVTDQGAALYASDSVGSDSPAFRLVFDFGAGALAGDAVVTPDDRFLVVALAGPQSRRVARRGRSVASEARLDGAARPRSDRHREGACRQAAFARDECRRDAHRGRGLRHRRARLRAGRRSTRLHPPSRPEHGSAPHRRRVPGRGDGRGRRRLRAGELAARRDRRGAPERHALRHARAATREGTARGPVAVSGLAIRPAEPRDVERAGDVNFVAFYRAALAHGLPPVVTTPAESRRYIRYLLDFDPLGGLVAEEDDDVIGVAWLHPRGAVATVGPVAVEPRHQGRGIGRRLLERLIEIAGKGVPQIRLVQESYNAASLALYLRTGFRVVAPLIELELPPDVAVAAPRATPGVVVRAAADDDRMRLVARDARAFGAQRPQSIDLYLRRGRVLVAEEAGDARRLRDGDRLRRDGVPRLRIRGRGGDAAPPPDRARERARRAGADHPHRRPPRPIAGWWRDSSRSASGCSARATTWCAAGGPRRPPTTSS
jgi:ribosomal protein S18 acetylase RimI-like enzyme